MRRIFGRRRAFIALWALLLAGAGVAGGYVLAPESASRSLPAGWNLCTNVARGYSLGYPAGWYTTHLTARDACGFFDPRPFGIPRDSDYSGTALEAHPETVSMERAVQDLTSPTFNRVVEEENVTAAGRRAVRLWLESTGEGLYEQGTTVYAYVVDRDGRAFLLQSVVGPDGDSAERRSIVDRAVRTLRFFAPRSVEVEGAPTLAVQAGLPQAVARKRAAIWEAASAEDYHALARLADTKRFTYTFGGPLPGGPAEYWRQLAATTADRPLQTLAALLELPYTKAGNVYVWPFAFDRDPRNLTPEERRLLERATGERELRLWRQAGSYLGWRAGIDAGGRWVFYVAGD